jgi:hypothetical protein
LRVGKRFLFVLLFAFIYSPFLVLGGVQLKLPIILHVAFFAIGLPFALRMYGKCSTYRVAANILVVNASIILLLFLLHGGADPEGLRLSMSAIVTLVGSAFFVWQYRRRYRREFAQRLMFHIFLVGTFHAVIIVAIIMVPQFGEWMKGTFYYTDKTLDLWGIRSPGLAVSGFGVLSLSQAMTGVLGLALLLMPREPGVSIPRGWILAGLPLIVLSIIASGRTGLVGLAFAFGVLFLFNARAILSNRRTRRVFVFSMCGLVAFVAVMLTLAEGSEYADIIRWAFEFYFTYEDRGEVATGSTNIVFESMYFLPDTITGRLLGTGNFGRLEPPLPSDVGYVLFIFGSGFVGLMSLLVIFVYVTVKALGAMRKVPMVGNAAFVITLMIVVANFKDPFFFHIYGTSQILFIIFALMALCLYDRKKETQWRTRLATA